MMCLLGLPKMRYTRYTLKKCDLIGNMHDYPTFKQNQMKILPNVQAAEI